MKHQWCVICDSRYMVEGRLCGHCRPLGEHLAAFQQRVGCRADGIRPAALARLLQAFQEEQQRKEAGC